MPPAARARPRRPLARVAIAVAVLALAGTLAFLPFAGRFLVRTDPLSPADAIFVLAGARVERWLEGVELYKEKAAPLVVLSPGRLEKPEVELRARGIRLPTDAEIARDAMLQLGVPADAIVILPGTLDNTAQEAAALRRFAADAGAGPTRLERIIVVTSKYHSRRTSFAFRREFDGTPVQLMVRASRFDDSEPARWWRHRADIRFVTQELQKLVLYRLGLAQ
jgi:uncharacterized SAM-binding protein YcdF (DUF218 family)